MIYLLPDDEIMFPDPRNGEPDGLFAAGGDLSPERLILAYQHGIFPWFAFKPEHTRFVDNQGNAMITWYCPMERFVIFPNKIHISHSMRQLINSKKYSVTFNKDFNGVIEHCSDLRIHHEYAWLGPEMVEAYKKLHTLHYAHSVEVWDNATGALVGGLYGVAANSCFCGESMFSLVPSASKLALITLAQILQNTPGTLIDCQFHTPHLESMGGEHISYEKYMQIINTEHNDLQQHT